MDDDSVWQNILSALDLGIIDTPTAVRMLIRKRREPGLADGNYGSRMRSNEMPAAVNEDQDGPTVSAGIGA
jgi:hypothetical protein